MSAKSLSVVSLLDPIELECGTARLSGAQRSTIEFITLLSENIHASIKTLARDHEFCFHGLNLGVAGKFIFECSDEAGHSISTGSENSGNNRAVSAGSENARPRVPSGVAAG